MLSPEPRLDGRKIGVPSNYYFENLDTDVEAAVRKALEVLEELGATLVDIEVPDIEEFNSVVRLILLAEAASVHHRHLREHREDFGDDVRALLDQGCFVRATDYLDAQRRRREFNDAFNKLLSEVDVIAAPTIAVTAAKIGEETIQVGGRDENVRLATTRLVRALNMTGLPLLSVPCGISSQGLPIGLQLIGGGFGEATLLEVGHAYEQATDWHKKRPPLAAS